MDGTPDGPRLAGALRFLAELNAVAAELAASGTWDDELTARRRQRGELREPRIAGPSTEAGVKAL